LKRRHGAFSYWLVVPGTPRSARDNDRTMLFGAEIKLALR